VSDFAVSDGTDECHAEFVPSAAVTIAIRHNPENLDLPIHMLNDNPLPRQPAIKPLLFHRQWSILSLLERNLTVLMKRRKPLITTVRLHLHVSTHRTAQTGFVKGKIMNTPRRLLNKKNQMRLQIDHDLRLYSMTLLLAGIVFLLFFFGRSIGLSVTSTATVFGVCPSTSSAFLPGKRNAPLRMSVFSTHSIDL